MSAASILRRRQPGEPPIVLPNVYDGITARLAEERGFSGVFIGSYATGATLYGIPDLGFIGLQDMVSQVSRLRPLLSMPIVVDAEGGFGNAIHAAHTVRCLERAGADVIQIEDQRFGKHFVDRPGVASLRESLDKIAAALDARADDRTAILARTDALPSRGKAETIDRVCQFAEAGADAVIVAAPDIPEDFWPGLRASVDVPLAAIDVPGATAAEMAARGADLVVQFTGSHDVAALAMGHAFDALKDGAAPSAYGSVPPMHEFDRFLGVDAIRAGAGKFWRPEQDEESYV